MNDEHGAWRMTPPRQDENQRDYALAWRDLRRRKQASWISGVGGFITMVIVSSETRLPLLFLLMPFIVFTQLVGWWKAAFRCPRCGAAFFRSGPLAVNTWRGDCAHCGLRIGAKETDE